MPDSKNLKKPDDQKKDEPKQPAPSPAPSVNVNAELDKMAELVVTELDALAEKTQLTVEDVRSQFITRIRHVRRVAAAPDRFSNGGKYTDPKPRR